ncbi:hypothetical protein Pmani_028376 [Petrolisthes manimaculis]|uniref:MOSC domain-containing protein n=1 Tax=Petrolisthes manimaculis TaxID=1843537 RepID=A0AAE1NZK3_9EUCA|nr:hypothetical protein Pmani_028376 [Petrolisthes manimaculis]
MQHCERGSVPVVSLKGKVISFLPLSQLSTMRSNLVLPQSVGVGVGVGVGVLMGWWAWRRYSHPQLPTQWEEAGEVTRLVVYPLKSGGGIQVNQADATPYGLTHQHANDRCLLVVTPDGKFITGRQAPRLTTIHLTFDGTVVTFTSQHHPRSLSLTLDLTQITALNNVKEAVVFNADVRGYDCGDEAATWVSDVTQYSPGQQEGQGQGQPPLRLLYNGDLTLDRVARKPTYYEFKQFKKTDTLFYADTCAYMLLSESSVEELNTRLHSPVTSDWFRSNIIVKGTPAYDEDHWAYVKIGDVILRRVKPCDRCVFTNVDPTKGTKTHDQEPLTTLKKYRLLKEPEAVAKACSAKPVFGVHLGINQCGTIRLGDKVLVARTADNPNWKF